jgi:hypothetical protein
VDDDMKVPGSTRETSGIGPRRAILLTVLAWLTMLAFDFFLHAGLLADLYQREEPFLLSPMLAFVRIPFGYLSFLVAAGLLVWVLRQTGAVGWKRGAQIGAVIGGAMWLSLGLGLYSITSAPVELLVGWTLGQTAEIALAGAMVGYARGQSSLRRPFLYAILAIILSFTVTAILQTIGWAPAVRFAEG